LSPPTTRRATVEVFDPASTREDDSLPSLPELPYVASSPKEQKTSHVTPIVACRLTAAEMFTTALRSNGFGADLIENSPSVEVNLPSRCLATL
jgi:hypothetical protein